MKGQGGFTIFIRSLSWQLLLSFLLHLFNKRTTISVSLKALQMKCSDTFNRFVDYGCFVHIPNNKMYACILLSSLQIALSQCYKNVLSGILTIYGKYIITHWISLFFLLTCIRQTYQQMTWVYYIILQGRNLKLLFSLCFLQDSFPNKIKWSWSPVFLKLTRRDHLSIMRKLR